MTEVAYFMIEGGAALKLAKQFVKDVRRVRNAAISLSKEIGADRFMVSASSGVLTGVDFGKTRVKHPDFKVPNRRGICFPKKGSEWAKRFQEQKGHESASYVISKAFDIPLSLSYGKTELTGWRHIGYPLNECGFLYPGEKGPFAMYVVDVPAEVAEMKKQGYEVGEPAKSFKMEFDGARRIEKEEWDIVVAQHALKQKGKAK
jgi:hypothetical protein